MQPRGRHCANQHLARAGIHHHGPHRAPPSAGLAAKTMHNRRTQPQKRAGRKLTSMNYGGLIALPRGPVLMRLFRPDPKGSPTKNPAPREKSSPSRRLDLSETGTFDGVKFFQPSQEFGGPLFQCRLAAGTKRARGTLGRGLMVDGLETRKDAPVEGQLRRTRQIPCVLPAWFRTLRDEIRRRLRSMPRTSLGGVLRCSSQRTSR